MSNRLKDMRSEANSIEKDHKNTRVSFFQIKSELKKQNLILSKKSHICKLKNKVSVDEKTLNNSIESENKSLPYM